MKIAAVVILYHPTEQVVDNIESYYNYVDEIFVFDNTEAKSLSADFFRALPKISYYHDYENKGIAIRLNTACNLCLHKEFEWLLTMDQDTTFTSEAISIYLNCFRQYKQKEAVSAFGTNYKRETSASTNACQSEEVDRLITSGMLLNLSAYKQIGGFDESLFIDLVDDEYCIASKKAGYLVVQFKNVFITHHLGKEVRQSSIKSLYLVKKNKEIHSALRCYYMYRNVLYIQQKYKGLNLKLAKDLKKIVVSHITVCVLYGRQTVKIIQYLIKARRDIKNNKLGKINKEI